MVTNNDILVHVLFVCMGNICRSPLAEFIVRQRAIEARDTGAADQQSNEGMITSGPAPSRRGAR